MGSITVDLDCEDFVDVVTEKSLQVIQTGYNFGAIRKKYVFIYMAVDNALAYYTLSEKQLTEIPVAIIAETMTSDFWTALLMKRRYPKRS
jgi:hypothetical protein